MAKIWIIGDFLTGAISESNLLPVIKDSDTITKNINAEDYATLQVSKRGLPNPADWKTYLQPVAKFVAAVDTDKAWNAEGAVLFAGYIKEAKLRVGDKITLQLASLREYASNRVATSAFSGSIPDAEAGKEWQGSDDQRLMTAVMRSIFDAQGQSSGSQPTPPQMQGTSTPAPNTGARTYKALNKQFLVLSDILDDIRDTPLS